MRLPVACSERRRPAHRHLQGGGMLAGKVHTCSSSPPSGGTTSTTQSTRSATAVSLCPTPCGAVRSDVGLSSQVAVASLIQQRHWREPGKLAHHRFHQNFVVTGRLADCYGIGRRARYPAQRAARGRRADVGRRACAEPAADRRRGSGGAKRGAGEAGPGPPPSTASLDPYASGEDLRSPPPNNRPQRLELPSWCRGGRLSGGRAWACGSRLRGSIRPTSRTMGRWPALPLGPRRLSSRSPAPRSVSSCRRPAGRSCRCAATAGPLPPAATPPPGWRSRQAPAQRQWAQVPGARPARQPAAACGGCRPPCTAAGGAAVEGAPMPAGGGGSEARR